MRYLSPCHLCHAAELMSRGKLSQFVILRSCCGERVICVVCVLNEFFWRTKSSLNGYWKRIDKLLNFIGMTPPGEVVVYSRKGCHLCEIVKESLVKLHKRGGFTWREIDVDSDAEIRRQYNDEVPVVFINGRKAFKYRMDEQEFLSKLSA